MAKHTPGPWFACVGDHESVNKKTQDGKAFRIFPHVHIGPIDHGQTYVSASGEVCAIRSHSITINEGAPPNEPAAIGTTMETVDANARLIAAAPDLAFALQSILKILPDGLGVTDAFKTLGEEALQKAGVL